MTDNHPPRKYYRLLGFSEATAEKIIQGFKVSEDVPTHEEWLEAMSEQRCPYCGDEDVDEDHILDCQPFDVET